MYAIIVHGGAGAWKDEHEAAALEGVRRAAQTGKAVLTSGGAALDAVVAAVIALEDDLSFNAGTGSALNLDGEAEMDAGIMVGQGLRTGNVAALKRVKNPVLVARKVMEETDHVLIAGEGALRFARAMGFPDCDPVTEERRADWRKKRDAMLQGDDRYLPRQRELLQAYPGLVADTVGAVALDIRGGLAAATSTGGLSLKLAGRIGDSPIPGAGNYADLHAAVSATGRGELMLRFLTAKTVCDLTAAGRSAQQAVDEVLARMAAEVGDDVGIIAVDATGRIGVGHRTPAMPHAVATEEQDGIVAAMRVA